MGSCQSASVQRDERQLNQNDPNQQYAFSVNQYDKNRKPDNNQPNRPLNNKR